MLIRKYFLADDDQDDRDLFYEALREIDQTIEFNWAQNGKELITSLELSDSFPQVIFLDLNMPEMNGWECLSELKKNEELKEIPVIVYSTSSANIDGRKAIHSGATGFLEKPPSFLKLKEFLEKISFASEHSLISTLRQIESTRFVKLVVA